MHRSSFAVSLMSTSMLLCSAQNTRSCMKRAGLPTPANHLIRSAADVPKAAEVVGFPAVIKPISGAASEGVVRVDSLEQLERYNNHRLIVGF